MNANKPTYDPHEQAALYVAGALTDAETTEFEQRLAAGDADVRAALGEYSDVATTLGGGYSIAAPKASRDKLLRLIDSAPQHSPQVWKAWNADRATNTVHTVRANEGTWDETGVPGVRVRKLFIDQERNQFTAVVKMEPGTSWPRHRHDGPEECMVLEGELHVGDMVMKKGDYQRAEPDSHHCIQRTETGCTLLIVSSLSDEVY
ncbi:MAG: cupin domain-containing protein [Phycisphaerae bacterium]